MFPIGFQRLFDTFSGRADPPSSKNHGAAAAEARPLAECLSHGSLTDLELLGHAGPDLVGIWWWEIGGLVRFEHG